jgi:hypothetical protein
VALGTQPAVEVEDKYSNPVLSGLPVTLAITGHTGNSAGTLSCTSNPVTSSTTTGIAAFAACSISASGSNYTLTATTSNPSLSAVSNPITINGPTELVFAQDPPLGALAAGSCNTLIIASEVPVGAGGVLTSPTTALTVNLAASNSAGTFYSGSGCTNAITTTTIGTSADTATVYYQDTKATSTNFTLTASTTTLPGITSATSYTYTVSAAAASQLVFTTSPITLTAGACSSTGITVTSEDQYGNVSNVATTAETISLGSTSTGTKAFYTASGCGTSETGTTIAIGSSSATFYYEDTQAGTPTITASGSGEFSSAPTQQETVNTAAASQLVWNAQPVGGVNPGAALATQPAVEVEDNYNNPILSGLPVTLKITSGTGNSAGMLSCTSNPVTSSTTTGIAAFAACSISASGSNYTLTATTSNPSLSAVSNPITINGPTQLVFTTEPAGGALTAGACNTLTITSENSSSTPTDPTTALMVNLAASNSAGTFYSGSGCTNAITTTTIGTSADTATVYYQDTKATTTSFTLTASTTTLPGITSATSNTYTVAPGTYTQLVVSAPSAATTNAQISFTVTAEDAYGNTETGNSDSITFTSTDSQAVLPSPSNLSNGTGSFNATFKTQGTQTISATDTTVVPNIKGTSGNIAVSTLLIITTSGLNPLDVGQSATQQLAATGGSGNSANYSWSWTAQTGSSLPPGVSLSTAGAMSGTATTANTYMVTVKVVDNSVSPSQNYSTNFTMTVYPALSLPTPDPASLPSTAYAGYPYNNGNGGTITGSGGSGSSNLSIAVSGTGLPADGLSASPSGATLTVSGTPVTTSPAPPYTVTFNVQLTDTTTGDSVTTNGYNINVVTPTAPSLPAASSTVPGQATENEPYMGSISLTGGVGPTYTWTLNGTTTVPTSGSVALGSSGLSSLFSIGNSGGGSSVSITGTPTSTGSVPFTLAVKDNTTGLTSATVDYTIVVSTLQVSVSADNVPQGMVNMPYTFNGLNISGGTPPYSVSSYVNAPPGLSLQSGTWNLAGTPTSSGTTTVTVNVTDSASAHASTTFSLTVVPETTTANNSELSGQYACYAHFYYDGGITVGSSTFYRGGIVFAFTADGNGNITGGEADTNNPVNGYKSASQNGSLNGGTYAVGSDNRGYLNAAGLYAIAGGKLNGSGQFTEFALTRMDDVGSSPSTHYGSGYCYQQNTTTSLSGITVSGGYVWEWRGEDGGGKLQSQVGSVQLSGGNVTSGEGDIADDGVYQNFSSLVGTYTTTDSYGRLTMSAGPSTSEESPTVLYITKNSIGEGVMMGTSPHNTSGSGSSGFFLGEVRAQVASAVEASYPLNGKFVMYTSGLDSDLSGYDTEALQASGSSSAASLTVNADIRNNEGTIKTKCPGSTGTCPATVDYTTNSTTGRTTVAVGGTTQTGVIFYVYNTGSAAVLFGDTGSSGTIAEDLIGWIEPQTAPTSGTWALSDVGASYFLHQDDSGNPSATPNTASVTFNNSGSFTYYAEDDGGQQWADWDEGLCGTGCTATEDAETTGALILDTTANSSTGALGLDPNSTIGIVDAQATQGSTTQTMAYCIAISVDTATNSSAKGRFVCVNRSSDHPTLAFGQQ